MPQGLLQALTCVLDLAVFDVLAGAALTLHH